MLEIGDKAPSFSLTAESGETVGLESFTGKSLIVFFYPKAMTPGCTTEASDFRDRAERLLSAGYPVVGISPDPVARLQQFREKESLNYPLLSDEEHAVAAAYGAWGIKKNYGREYEGLIRSTFVIGPDGTLTHAYRNVRAKGHVARLAKELLDE